MLKAASQLHGDGALAPPACRRAFATPGPCACRSTCPRLLGRAVAAVGPATRSRDRSSVRSRVVTAAAIGRAVEVLAELPRVPLNRSCKRSLKAHARRSVYHPRRLIRGTRSKCASRLKTGSPCSRASAAIHASLAGIGVPRFLSAARTSA